MNTYAPAPILTLDEGLEIQKQQLVRWSMLLKPSIQAMLEAEAVRQNRTLNNRCSGYDVWRGCDMQNFVLNIPNSL